MKIEMLFLILKYQINLLQLSILINSFVLSKVWFKCHSVDLRVADINSISSKVKSWLFQDQLEKPEEMVLHRPISVGGFGLHNVKYKALASLIRTFMETAANPKFQLNLFHSLLYRVNVLDDDSITPPPLPPYYPASFFNIIKQVRLNTPLNVTTMSTANWYRLLVEQEAPCTRPSTAPGSTSVAELNYLHLTQTRKAVGDEPD